MPYCAIYGCKKSSNKSSLSKDGITFHCFPKNPQLAKLWIKVCDRDVRWKPTRASCICSRHFELSQFQKLTNNRRKLIENAIPTLYVQPTNHQLYIPANTCEIMTEENQVLACRICLQMDCKLYSLKRNKLYESYQLLTGLSLDDEDTLPMSLCVQCSTLLCKYQQFRDKSHLAHQCLMDIVKNNAKVTLDDIKAINRNKLLRSNLSITRTEPNCFDYQFIDETDILKTETPIKTELIAEFNKINDDDDNFDATYEDKSMDSDKLINIKHTTTKFENDLPIKSVKNQIIVDVDMKHEMVDNITIDVPVRKVPSKAKNPKRTVKATLKSPKKKKAPEKSFAKTKLLKKNTSEKGFAKTKRLKKNTSEKGFAKTKRLKMVSEALNKMLQDNFTVKSLTIEEQKEMINKRKSSKNYMSSSYKCDYCFVGFTGEVTLEIHMMSHNESNGNFVCEICHKIFSQRNLLRKHMSNHTHLYSCKTCPYTAQQKSSANLHLQWHKGKVYKCEQCDAVFERSTSLKSHGRIKHPSDKHVCCLCGYSFLGEDGLKLHRTRKHKHESAELPADSPRCELCDISFVSMDALQTHQRVSLRHSDGGRLKRNEPVHIRGPKDKRREKDDPRNERAVLCKVCGMRLSSLRMYNYHITKLHPSLRVLKPSDVLCDVCGKVFHCQAVLRDHLLVHSEEAASFSCTVCSKSFKTRMALRIHERRHYLSFPCPKCGKTFNHKANRDRHFTYVHSDLKDVKCDYCDKFFKSKPDKKLHTDHVHLNKPWPLKKNRVRKGQSKARRASKTETTEDSDD